MSEKTRVCGNRAKAKCVSGWAAFDLNQGRNNKHQILESNNDSEAFPLLSVSAIAPRSCSTNLFNKNEALLEKPYASVVVASPNYPSLSGPTDTNSQTHLPVCNTWVGTTAQNIQTGNVYFEDYQKLKFLYPWVDESLIQDVFTGVNNNVDEALSLLEAMFVSEEKNAMGEKVESSGNRNASFDIQSGSIGEKTEPSITVDDSFNRESKDDLSSVQFFGGTKSLSIEPEVEWVEDDLYLIHRKDAIRMIRSASRHSKSANDAYLRGDHASAFQFSLKAQEEWRAAENLNAKAAKEILNIRNCKNDLWTLDLHGLHAAEAVDALSERLQTVEFLVSPNRLAASGGVNKKSSIFHAASVRSTTSVNMGKVERQVPPIVKKINLLQVITGKGNHSRGGAALPSAIRNFLSENGYHFDETRSGAITIRPKFRQQ